MHIINIADHQSTDQPVHVYLADKSERMRLTEDKIAEEIGMTASMWRLIKAGRVNITDNKIESIAKALGLEPEELFRRVMSEYSPCLVPMIDRMFDGSRVTEGERRLIEQIRNVQPDPTTITLTRSSDEWSLVQTS